MRRTRFFTAEQATALASPAWSPCEARIVAFEEAWRRGASPLIQDYLKDQLGDGLGDRLGDRLPLEGDVRRALLVELVHIDLELRLRKGESVRVESYLREYPELGQNKNEVIDLIAAEHELRRRHQGAVVGAEEYFGRFPEHRAALSDYFASQSEDTACPPAQTQTRLAPPAVPGYEIVAEIGRGGMGVVYLAREPNLGRHVALKFLPFEYIGDPDRLERFLREARTASALNHPHICTVHALGEHEGRPFLVMEFIDGLTLQAFAARQPRLEEVARLIRQAAQALAAAHAAGVVHRDIKPENIMVRGDGYVKVLDFGLARRLPTLAQPFAPLGPPHGQSLARLVAQSVAHSAAQFAQHAVGAGSDPGAVLGTAAYMSPEQARGEPVDSASDIFSLGIVLYQLTTGQHPFEADSAFGMLQAIATQPPVPPSRLNREISVSLQGLIEAMLHKDARLRPTASEVETALASVASKRAGLDRSGSAPPIVHREPELAALREALHAADARQGSMVCIAGEPGIGKTTLVEDFLEELANLGGPGLVARGHCSERLAGTEAYLPVIDALADLLRSEAGAAVARRMKVVAPTWYARVVPTKGDGSSAEGPDAKRAFSQSALLREFHNLLLETSRIGPLVLFLDDVHWADISTVDLLAHFGRHCQGLRVLLVVTYRPTELLLGPHSFHAVKLELQSKGACAELRLGFLDRRDIDRYMALAFPGHAFPEDFGDLVYARTEGSPLFVADLLRYLRERGVVAETGGRWSLARELPDLRQELPESIRSMIQRKLDRLSEEDRQLLSAASVQGHEFDSAAVAGGLNRDPAAVEERLQVLDRVHGLVRLTREYEFPDRTLTLRYAFVHILYQQALFTGLTPTRRAALSGSLARVLETHHGEANPVAAAELACLYEAARDFARSARKFHLAAQNAARVFAHREAVVLARRGLRLLQSQPETPERAALELPLLTTLGLQLQVTEGYAARSAEEAYRRARRLCAETPNSALLFPVLWGLWLICKVRSDLPRAQQMAEELLEVARRLADPSLALQAHQALGLTSLCRGESAAAVRHVEQVAALYDPERHHTHAFLFGQDPAVICKAYGAVALWFLGYPEAARTQSDEAVRMGQDRSPTSQAVALHFAAMLHQLRRDGPRTLQCAEASRFISTEHGFPFWLAGGTVLSGWALAACGAADEGIERIRQGLREWHTTGSVTYETYFLGLLADTLGRHGDVEECLRVIEEGLELARRTDEKMFEAELYRMRGEMVLRLAAKDAVQRSEEDLLRAVQISRQQEAKSLELRAAMALTRHRRRLGFPSDARDQLAEALSWFTEGLETPDLRDARQLCADSSR